jgi:tRNA(His) 5'-end guanylyltransferase
MENRLIDVLGQEMKAKEVEMETKTDGQDFILVRLDGHSFSKLTKKVFERTPVDFRFAKIMKHVTTELLLRHNNATLAYCHSDEITIVFPPHSFINKKDGSICFSEHPFSGRSQKLASLLASEAGILFERICRTEFAIELPTGTLAAFDGRVLKFAGDDDGVHGIHRYFVWRSHLDCYRNFIHGAGHHLFGHKAIHGLSVAETRRRLEEANFDFKAYPDAFYHGVFVKKEMVTAETENGPCERRRAAARTLMIGVEWKDMFDALFREKLWTPELVGMTRECVL